MERTDLKGAFVRVDEALLREKAGRAYDPRKVFYQAMLDTDTYYAYTEIVRGISVSVPTYKTGPIDGRMEILYARRSGWISDAG